VLVPFADPLAIAREASGLLRDGARRHAMSANAYRLGRDMVWSHTAGLYFESFERARRQQAESAAFGRRPHESPELNLDHVYRMTDSTGIFQHATLTEPNLSEGYCTDDNARALVLAILLGRLEEAPKGIWPLATTYAAFLDYAFNPKTARFHNFLDIGRHWLDIQGSEDSHGRALWALGTAVGRSSHWSSQSMAQRLFDRALRAVVDFKSPRAWAFGLIGIHEYLRHLRGNCLAGELREDLTGRLVTLFDKVAEPGWVWFEEGLSYDNAKLPHALILSGRATGQSAVFERGMRALRWLVGVQTSRQGRLRPIGSNGFYPRNGPRADFDQQPIEAQSTVSACLAAFRATSDLWWYDQAQRAFDWFLGWNDLSQELYCPQTGGCCDGLHVDRRNQNQGAESTLAFLLSLTEMRLIQSEAAGIRKDGLAVSITQ
jgi:hypothetical protein